MIITTMNDLPGYRIDEVLGEVFGLTVRSRHVGSQIGASFKSLFGGGAKSETEAVPKVSQEIEHRGFTIQATPYKEAGQYQTCGIIAKVIDGVRKEHKFIRADRFASLDEAVDCSLSKGRQMVELAQHHPAK